MNAVFASNQSGGPLHGESHRGTWYLIREDMDLGGKHLQAGTPILKVSNGWIVDGSTAVIAQPLDKQVCRTEYAGLSLHIVSREADGGILHRRLGADGEAQRIPLSRVLSPPEVGRTKVYLAFGDQFYPLEYFGW